MVYNIGVTFVMNAKKIVFLSAYQMRKQVSFFTSIMQGIRMLYNWIKSPKRYKVLL